MYCVYIYIYTHMYIYIYIHTYMYTDTLVDLVGRSRLDGFDIGNDDSLRNSSNSSTSSSAILS